MPKGAAMSQLSRPFQIGLLAVAVLALVWFVALRGHSSESTSTPAARTPATTPTTPGSPTTVYHGSAPGVEGLTKAIAKAHGAVATSQQNAAELQHRSAQASGEAGAASGSTSSSSSSSGSLAKKASSGGATPSGAWSPGKLTGRPAELAKELAKGQLVVLFVWNPRSSDDQAVRAALTELSHHSKISLHVALSGEVATYGSFTQDIQVLQTPSVLLIDKDRQVTTITGFTDARSLEQALGDVTGGGAGRQLAPTFTAWTPTSSRASYLQRTNALCKQPLKAFVNAGSLHSEITSFHAFVADVVVPVVNKIRSIPPPAQDRPFVNRYFGEFVHGFYMINAAVNEYGAGHRLQARTLLLETQAKFDEASTGLASYGLTSCVGRASY